MQNGKCSPIYWKSDRYTETNPKPEGKLVYATCSILPQENKDQVKTFLESEEGKDFILIRDKNIYASVEGFDGFYMALLQRK
mgnify:CR=1 FL=1